MMHLAKNLNILTLITIAGASAISPSTRTYLGCFSSTSETFSADFVALGAYRFQSPGYCSNACFASGYSVFALTSGVQCLCGSAVPPSSDLVDATKCSLPCSGYLVETCGGSDALDVYSMDDDATGSALITATEVTAVPTTSTGYEYTALSSSGIGYLPVPDSSSSVITTTGPAVVVTAGSDSLTASLTSSSNSSSTTPAATTTSLHSSTAALVTPSATSATSATSAAKSPVSTGAAAGIRVQGIAQLISALFGLGIYMLF